MTALRTHRGPLAVVGFATVAFVVAQLALVNRFPWFVDETIFADVARTVQADPAQRFLALNDQKGLINSWIQACLIGLGLEPMQAVRALSSASILATAAATGSILARWCGAWPGAIGFALTAFVPYLFVHASVGVHDPLVAACSMIALGLQLELSRRPRLDVALLLGFVLGIGLLAKPTAALAVALLPFSLLVFDFARPQRLRRLALWGAAVILALAIAALLWNIRQLSPLAALPAPDNHRTIGDLLNDPFAGRKMIAKQGAQAVVGYLTVPGVLLATWGAWLALARRERIGLIFVVWAGAAGLLMLLLTDAAFPRYGIQIAAPAVGLVVLALLDLSTRIRRRPVLIAGCLVAATPALVLDIRVLARPVDAPYPGLDRVQYVSSVSNRQPVVEAARRIERLAAGQRTVSVGGFGGWPWATTLTLGHLPGFTYAQEVPQGQPAVLASQFVIVEGDPPPWLDVANRTVKGRWQRPGGAPVTLYARNDPGGTQR